MLYGIFLCEKHLAESTQAAFREIEDLGVVESDVM